MKRLALLVMCFVLCSVTLFAGARGDRPFPSRQITILVGASPGGTSDVIARTIGRMIEVDLGVPVVIQNRPGGSSAVATEFLAAQSADGYTLMYFPVENAMIRPLGLSQHEPRNFTYLVRAMTLPATVTVSVDSPWYTFQEFIDFALANPGQVTVGNSGPGSIWHFGAVGLEMATGAVFTHVPFDGGAAAATAVMGGHVNMSPVAPGEVRSGVDAGMLRVLAVMGNERSPLFPDVPSLSELGVQVDVFAWGAFGGPANMAPEARQILEEAFTRALHSQEWMELAAANGWTPAFLNAADAQRFAEEQAAWYQNVIPTLNLN